MTDIFTCSGLTSLQNVLVHQHGIVYVKDFDLKYNYKGVIVIKCKNNKNRKGLIQKSGKGCYAGGGRQAERLKEKVEPNVEK